jgi:PE-PPE domain
MRVIMRSLCVAVLALLGTIGLAVAWTMTTAVQLLAATALIMGGSDHPLSTPPDTTDFVTAYIDTAVDNYIDPDPDTDPPINRVAVIYPAQFFPVFGSMTFDDSVREGRVNLNGCIRLKGCTFNPGVGSSAPAAGDTFAVFGLSQSAVVASLVKRDLIDNPTDAPQEAEFFLIANPMRPNGGILMRFFGLPTIPFFGITFYGASPTDSEVLDDGGTPDDPTDDTYAYPTIDVAHQYDALGGDFPYRPLNFLATINSFAGAFYFHGDVINRPLTEAQFQGRQGDTSYYLFPARTLPILLPLEQIGVPSPIVRFLDTLTRVVVEDAYRRDINPGVPTAASLLPIGNPITLALKLLAAIPVAIDDALQEMGLGRPLGTTPAGPYGVGGPPLPDPPSVTSSTGILALAAPVVEEEVTESVAPEARSLAGDEPLEPVADPEPLTDPELFAETDDEPLTDPEPGAETDDEPESVEPETDTEELAETTTPETNGPLPAAEPDRPKVRGPIEFDSPDPQEDSPSDDQPGSGDATTSAPDPSPAETDNTENQDAA